MAFATVQPYGLANFMPYTMNLTYYSASQQGDSDWNCFQQMPAQTILPGANMVFSLITERQPPAKNDATAELHYDFTDVDGGQHRCRYLVGPDGYLYVYSQDLSDGTYANSVATFEITESAWYQVNCVLTKSAEVTIDAGQDAATATSVVANLWPQGTDQDFTATAPVQYTTGSPFVRGSAMVVNGTEVPVSLTMAAGDTTSETTSLALTLAWSTSLNILDLVNQKLSASITGGESWQQSVSLSSSEGMTIEPGQQGWLQWSTVSAVVTGDFTFTWTPVSGNVTPAGVTYHVNNVTITQPGFSESAITWEPYSEAIQASPSTPAGVRARSAVALRPELIVGDSAVVIDAVTDPAGAANAMALWPTAPKESQSFTATTNPVYSATQPTTVSNHYQVPAKWPNAESFSFDSTLSTTSGWSIGGSVGMETTLSALGFANASVSITFTASHEWDTTSSNSQTIGFEISPGYIGWVEGSTGQVTFTGDFAFTADGTDYVVKNVTITNPGSADCGPDAAFTYYAVIQPLSPSAADAMTRPGLAAEPYARPVSAEVPSATRQHEDEEHTDEHKHGNGRHGHGQTAHKNAH
jgi:hypothetical protein